MDKYDEVNFSRYFSSIEKYARKFRNEKFEKYGFKGNQYYFVMMVVRHPGISQDNLVQRTMMDKGNAARQLAQLEENGYIRREADPDDRRLTNIYPTEKGEEANKEIRKVLHQWNEIVSAGLTSEENELLHAVMEKLLKNARSLEDDRQ